jgi:hypothetical protein
MDVMNRLLINMTLFFHFVFYIALNNFHPFSMHAYAL